MVKISGWVYVVIGFLVAIPSYVIDKEKMFLFLLLGVIFIGIGFIKIFSATKTRPKQQTAGRQGRIQKQHPKPRIVFCPYCGQAVYETQQFCHRCRSRLKQ